MSSRHTGDRVEHAIAAVKRGDAHPLQDLSRQELLYVKANVNFGDEAPQPMGEVLDRLLADRRNEENAATVERMLSIQRLALVIVTVGVLVALLAAWLRR